MKCLRCKSLRMMKFVDGFGDRRVYCRTCGMSFLETNIRPNEQMGLLEFNSDLHIPPGERI